MTPRPITDDDLHGYVDQQLAPNRTEEVRAYLADHPEVSARINGYVEQRERLRAAPGDPTSPGLEKVLQDGEHPGAWISVDASLAPVDDRSLETILHEIVGRRTVPHQSARIAAQRWNHRLERPRHVVHCRRP
jgi:hypothetical protein